MRRINQPISVLLVLMLVLPMLLLSGSAIAEREYLVKSTGGPVHVWPEAKKAPGTALGKLKNGTQLVVLEKGTAFHLVSGGGLEGWMDAKYVGSREVKPQEPEKPIEVLDYYYDREIRGTAPDSIINIWPTMKNRGKNVMVIPVGAQVNFSIAYDNGWSWVWYEKAPDEFVEGFVQTKWLVEPKKK